VKPETIIANLEHGDWEKQVLGLEQLSALVRQAEEGVPGASTPTREQMVPIMRELHKHISSLRSRVSLAAVRSLEDVYTHAPPSLLESYSDVSLSFMLLLAGSPAKAEFMKSVGDSCLRAIVQKSKYKKMLPVLTREIGNKAPGVRERCALFLAGIFAKEESQAFCKAISGAIPSYIKILVRICSDGNEDCRRAGRQFLVKFKARMGVEDICDYAGHFLTLTHSEKSVLTSAEELSRAEQ